MTVKELIALLSVQDQAAEARVHCYSAEFAAIEGVASVPVYPAEPDSKSTRDRLRLCAPQVPKCNHIVAIHFK